MTSIRPDEDLPPGLQEIVSRDRQHDPGPWGMLKNALLIFTFGGACLSIGYNLRELATVKDTLVLQASQNDKEHATFARRDVVDEQYRALQQQYVVLQRQMDRIESLLGSSGRTTR